MEPQTSLAAVWSRRLAWFSAVLFAVSGAGHRFALLETVSFLWTLAVIGLIAGVALLLAATSFRPIWNRGDRGAWSALAGAAVALAVLSPFLYSAYCVFSRPELYDISTDTADPPVPAFAAQQRGPGMNAIGVIADDAAVLQAENYPGIIGHRYDLPLERVEEIIGVLAATHGWKAVARTGEAPGEDGVATVVTMEYLAVSPLLGFPADVALRLIEEHASTYVDMRSVSRYGRHDLGSNAQRIKGFLAELDTSAALQTAVTASDAAGQ